MIVQWFRDTIDLLLNKSFPHCLSLISAFYQSCAKSKGGGKGGEGKGYSDDLCKSEPKIYTRIYDITIAATDMAGNKGEATCSIIVVPEDRYRDLMDCNDPTELRRVYANSIQRYNLTDSSSSLTWNPMRSSNFVPPSIDQVQENFGDGKGGYFIPKICKPKGKSGKRDGNVFHNSRRARKMRTASGQHDD